MAAAARRTPSRVYLPGNWPVPFGIVLALDRLSALMLVLAGVLRRWPRCCSRWRAGIAPACTSIRCCNCS